MLKPVPAILADDVPVPFSKGRSSPAKRRNSLISASLLVGVAMMPGLAMAQSRSSASDSSDVTQTNDGLADIIVTAERRVANLQDTAASIAVRSGAQLQELGRFSVREVLEDVPGVDFGASNPNTPGNGIFIRGIRPAQTPVGVSASASTALYVDGVYNGVGSGYDIDRVEVLRGPQGTLYGRSATGGVVSFHTRNPGYDAPHADVAAEIGNYGLHHVTGGAGIPLVQDKLAIRISGNHYERDGFISAKGGYSRVDEVRGKLGFKPSDNIEIILAAVSQKRKDNSGGAYLANVGGKPADYTITSGTAIGTVNSSQHQFYANVDIDMGFATLTYIPSWRKYTREGISVVGNTQIQLNQTPRDVLHTEELRLGKQYSNGLSWVGGLFYYDGDENVRVSPRWTASGALVFDQTTKRRTRNWGIFGEVTVPLTDAIRLTGGLRYDETKIQSNLIYILNSNRTGANTDPTFGLPERLTTLVLDPAAGRSRFTEFTYKARIEADLAKDNMVYAMISTGSLPGDVQATTGAGNVPIVLPFAQQELTAYEIGMKNRFWDILQINASAFYYDYSGYQAQLNIGTGAAPNYLITTSPAKVKGFELETLLQASRNDRITLSVGYSNAEYTGFTPSTPLTVAQSRYGNYVPGISPWRINAAYERQFDITDSSQLSLRVAARYSDSYYSASINNNFANLGAVPYTMARAATFVDANAALRLSDGLVTISAYVRNIGNLRPKTGSSISGTAIAGTNLPFGGNPTIADPRTFGVVGRISF